MDETANIDEEMPREEAPHRGLREPACPRRAGPDRRAKRRISAGQRDFGACGRWRGDDRRGRRAQGRLPGLPKRPPYIAAAQGPTKVAPPSDDTVSAPNDAGAAC